MTQELKEKKISDYTFNNLTTSYKDEKLVEGIPVEPTTDVVDKSSVKKNLNDYIFNKKIDVESTKMPDTEYVPPEDDGLIPRPPEPTDEIDDAWYMKASELPEDKTIDRIEKLKKDTMQMRETIATQAKKKGITQEEFIENTIIPSMPDGEWGSTERIVKSLLSATGSTGFATLLNVGDWINEGIGGLGNALETIAINAQENYPEIYKSLTVRNPASLANQLVRDTGGLVSVLEAATMGVVTASNLGFKSVKKLNREMKQLKFNKFYEAPSKFNPNIKGITYEAMRKADELAEKTARDNPELMDRLLKDMETITGKNLTMKDDKTGLLVPDPEKYRLAGMDILDDINNPRTSLEYLEEVGETRKNEMIQPILKIDKLNAVVAMASELNKKFPDYFKKDTIRPDGTKITVIDNLFDATVEEKLVADPEFMKTLTKYNLSFEEYILTVVGSGSKAGQVLNRLSQIKRATSLRVKDAKKEKLEIDQQNVLRKNIVRLENIRRGILVSQFKTAARNLTSAYIRGPLEGLQNVFDTVLYNLGAEGAGKAGLSLIDPVNWAESFRHMKYMFSDIKNVQEYTDFILKNDKLEGLHTIMFEQVGEIRKSIGNTTKNPAVNAAFQGMEDVVDVLNVPNRFQEFLVRRAVFMGELERLVKREYNVDLIKELNKGKLPDFLNDAMRPEGARSFYDIAASATTRALDVTFAKSPDVEVFKDTANFITRNGLTVVMEFPRFTFNSLELMGQYSGGAAYALIKRLTTGKGVMDAKQRQRISRNLVGWAAIYGAYQYRTSDDAPENYQLVRSSEEAGVNVTPQWPMRQLLYMGEALKQLRQGGPEQLGKFLTSDFGAEGFETFVGAPLRRGVSKGITQEIGALLTTEGIDVITDVDGGLTKTGAKLFANYLQTYAVPFAQVVDVQRGIGYRGTLKKDVARDPQPDSDYSPTQEAFVRPFNQQAMFMTPEEEEALPVRTDLYGRDDRLKNLERAFLGLNFEELPNESGKFLQSLGIKGFKISSRSKIPSIKREENKFLAKHIPVIVTQLQNNRSTYEQLYDRLVKEGDPVKNTLTKEGFVKEEMKDKFLTIYRKIKSSFKPSLKDMSQKQREYIFALETYRKIPKQKRIIATNRFRLTTGTTPEIYNSKDIFILINIAKRIK